ncbi:MAG: response regulator transcription factor [Neptuniibacter sp.]
MKINILLVDDHAVVRAGFKMLISCFDFVAKISEASTGEEALRIYNQQAYDVVVIDISMPGIGGLETIRRLHKKYPNVVILVYSIHDSPAYIEHSMLAGAIGYINKNSEADIMAKAIVEVYNGNYYIDTNYPFDMKYFIEAKKEIDSDIRPIDKLSPREFDVFCLLAKGLNTHEISDNLCLSYKTIANYNTQIKNKLNIKTSSELIHIAMVSGVLKV